MQNGKGAPEEKTLNKLLDWCKENTQEEESYMTLLSSITGMQCGKGAPEEKTLNKLLDWCKENTPEEESYMTLLSSITGMQHGKGAPKEEVLDSIEALYRVVEIDHIQQWLDGPFLELDPHERLEKLHTQLQQNGSDAFDPITLLMILPKRLSSKAFLNDLKPSKARLDLLDKNSTIFLDSAEERTVAGILYHYGFISDFVQGKNYHVPTQGRRSLDFLLENHKVFIEYHPLSRGDKREGITLQQAGQRKIDSINQGRFKDYKVYHISRLDELWAVLNEVGFESPPTFDQFSETKRKSSEHRSLILAI